MASLSPDAARVQVYAQLQHGRFASKERSPHCSNRSPHWADPSEVGRIAAKLARRYFNGQFGEEASSGESVARRSGFLVYAMQCYACNFEAVCDVSEFAIASVLSQITPNITLPPGLRNLDLRSRVAQAGATAQAVRLAEIYAAATRLTQTVPAVINVYANDLKGWVDDSERVLASLTKLHASRRMAEPLRQTKDLLARTAHHIESCRKATRVALPARCEQAALGMAM